MFVEVKLTYESCSMLLTIYDGRLQEGTGHWISLDAEQIMEEGVVVGTRNPTGDFLLLDCRFEMPYGMLLQSEPIFRFMSI